MTMRSGQARFSGTWITNLFHSWSTPLIALIFLFGASDKSIAAEKVALVIGNSSYVHAPPLVNPVNDAKDISTALKNINFDVYTAMNASRQEMLTALSYFKAAISESKIALFYYAGHGIQVDGTNYIIPIDAQIESRNAAREEAITLDDITTLMEKTDRFNIIILDACRDNPWAAVTENYVGGRSIRGERTFSETSSKGLAVQKAGAGTLIVFATSPGKVAYDGGGRNSPFSAALAKNISAPNLTIEQVLKRVRQNVLSETNGLQLPWDQSSMLNELYLVEKPQTFAPPSEVQDVPKQRRRYLPPP
jgi:uncharacterized protein